MSTASTHRVATSTDRAEILTLIHSRHPAHHAALKVESRELTINMEDDFALSRGLVQVSGTRRENQWPAHFWMHETVCFERSAEGWRIVHEHTSAPFALERGAQRGSGASSKLRVDWAPRNLQLQPCR